MKNKVLSILMIFLFLFLSFTYINTSAAATNKNVITTMNISATAENENKDVITTQMINNRMFYIKNAYSGLYLDVNRGIPEQGRNVQQYHFNGGDSQKWYIILNDDGTFTIASHVGTTTENGVTYIHYVLDISGGNDGGNGVNAQIWTANHTIAQKFQIGISSKLNYTIVLLTGTSNYKSAITVEEKSCSDEANVFQYQYNASTNDEWILEPVNHNISLAQVYAKSNHNKYVEAFPDMTNFEGRSKDCANFASQCLLVTGDHHYEGKWQVYRKNGTYSKPSDVKQLDETWELCAPDKSPWVSSDEFAKFWKENRVTYAKGSEIVSNKDKFWGLGIIPGDIIQTAQVGFLNMLGDADHTMFVYDLDTANRTYLMAQHSDPKMNSQLSDAAARNPDSYFIFYSM